MKKALRFLSTGIVFVFVLLQCGCTQTFNFKMEYDKGLRAYNEKDYESAVINLNNALNYNPDSYSTYCLLGTAYGYKGDTKNSKRVLLEAVQKFPDKWNAYSFLGDLERTAKNYPEAIDYYEKAAALDSMPANTKPYYQNLIAEVKREQNKILLESSEPQEVRLAKLLEEKKNGAKPVAAIPAETQAQTKEPVTEVNDPLQLDWTVWETAYTVSNQDMSVTEYGKKGEDVKNYNWTELVTIQHLTKNASKQYTASSYLDSHLKPITDMAKNTQKTFSKTILSESPSEIIYQWAFDGGKESEIARVVLADDGIYHYHYAKKGSITAEEINKWLTVLKNAKGK